MLLLQTFQKAIASADFRSVAATAVAVVAGGAVFFHLQEGLGWLDAFYFTTVTLTTVGYGDFSPATDGGKLFLMAYVVVGLGVMAALLGLIAELALEVTRERRADP